MWSSLIMKIFIFLLLFSTSVWAHTPHVLNATVCLIPPTQNADGSALNLDGYRFCADRAVTDACNGVQIVQVTDVTQVCFAVVYTLPAALTDPTPGDEWFFSVYPFNGDGEGLKSNTISEFYPFPTESPPGDAVLTRVTQ